MKKNDVFCHISKGARVQKSVFNDELMLAILSALRRGQHAEIRSKKSFNKLIRELTFILNLVINLSL